MRINNIKLRYKLAIIYLITGFLPIVILFSFSYVQMKKILTDRDAKSVQSYLNQSVESIDGQIQIYNNLSNYLSFNETISKIVSYDYDSEYDMYMQFAQTFDPMVSSLKCFHNDINQVTIYTDNVVKHDNTIAPISDISDKKWYAAAYGSIDVKWFADAADKELFSARRMPTFYNDKLIGIMYINVDYDNVFSVFKENTSDNYGIIIVDGNGNEVFSYNGFSDKYKDCELDTQGIISISDDGSWDNDILKDKKSGYSIVRKALASTGWMAYVYEPASQAMHSTQPIFMMFIVASVIAVIASIMSIVFTSKFVTGRIKRLEDNMHEVEKGNFDITVTSDDKDEIGELIHGFGDMVTKINNLITQVYQGRINQKEYEMRALMAQINPHFLYNSLSLINWKAIEYEQQDISDITLALSNYYRTSLNKGKNTLSVRMELMNMTSYLDIQKVMHDNSFDVVVDVSEKIYDYETLNLILQPLVENAIDHGIDLKTDGRGIITIKGDFRQEDDGEEFIVITVSDNGIGMSQEEADKILTVNSGGYGARNVNERIKLYYGEEYSMKIYSEVGRGTEVVIRFPAKKYIND